MSRRGENGWRIATGMPLRTIGALREISCRVEGLRVDEVRARFPELWRRNVAQPDPRFARPGRENYRASRARVWRAIVRIAAAHPGQRVVAVTHAVAGSRCRAWRGEPQDSGEAGAAGARAVAGGQCLALPATRRPGAAVRRCQRATALYRGDLLDPEDCYESWAEGPRERCRRSQIEALAELSLLLASRADYERAATAMRAVVALDPVREAAYRDLMHYALLCGRREDAITTYRECVQALEQGLGVAPEPSTRRLLDEVHRPA